MTASVPPPPPPAWSGAPAPVGPLRVHPMATASLVLGLGIFLPVIAGLIGAPLGALARRSILAAPNQWRGLERAHLGLGLSLVFGAVPVMVLSAVKADDWGWGPFAAGLIYLVVVFGLAVGQGAPPTKVAGVAAAGVGGVLVMAVVASLAAVLIGLLLYRLAGATFDFIVDSILNGSSEGSS